MAGERMLLRGKGGNCGKKREKGERGVRSILRIFMNSKLESEVASEKRHEVLFLLLSFFRLQLKEKRKKERENRFYSSSPYGLKGK